MFVAFVYGNNVYEKTENYYNINSDARQYNEYAINILTNVNWLSTAHWTEIREPLYPLFIAFIYSLFGIKNYLAVYIAQSLLSIVLCYLIYIFIRKAFNKFSAIIGFLIAGIYTFYIFFTAYLIRETLVFTLLFASFYFLFSSVTCENKYNKRYLFITAVFLTLLFFTDARYLFFLPFLFIIFFVYKNLKESIKSYSLLLAMIFLFLIPWNVRNYIVYDSVVFMTPRLLDLRPQKEHSRFVNRFFFDKITQPTSYYPSEDFLTVNFDYPKQSERDSIKEGFNPKNRLEYEINMVKSDIYADSTFWGMKRYWLNEFWKPFSFKWSYFPFPSAYPNHPYSMGHNITSILCYGLLLPFSLIGVFFLIKRKQKILIFLLIPVIVQTILHLLTLGIERYRNPIDVFIIILGSVGINYVLIKLRIIKNNSHQMSTKQSLNSIPINLK